MSLEKEMAIAHQTCPCWETPWAATKCRNCATQGKHYVDDCEWRGHAAFERVVVATRLDDLEKIKAFVDRDHAISAEVRKTLQQPT